MRAHAIVERALGLGLGMRPLHHVIAFDHVHGAVLVYCGSRRDCVARQALESHFDIYLP